MSGFNWLKGILEKLGESVSEYQDSHLESNYTPRFDGQWVNKGTRKAEKWVWVEQKSTQPTWVNIFQVGDDFIITMGDTQRIDAIDSTKCENEYQAIKLMESLACFYKHQGKVTIVHNNEEVEEDYGNNRKDNPTR